MIYSRHDTEPLLTNPIFRCERYKLILYRNPFVSSNEYVSTR
jgi:hypothetical protein